ncbi:hypothetical protein PPYR_02577 [Photinus pyralis]|uniref:Uncharacterized protein n=1 Tax=Photinus pyralis TaxID=7054 RepID=A0A5N4B7M7_PHOPY|nr:hypothetical protein PPYR_02577 [Photinus pyralis]
MLPTCAEVIKHYLWVRSDLMWISNGKDPSIKEICAKIATDLSNLWKKASLPIISNQQIISRLIDYYKKYKNLMKCRVTQKKADFYETARKTLFDISVCKCACLDSCKCSTKIPRAEREFLTDQRGDRKMYIGSIDAKSTKVMARKQLRREFEELRQSQSVMKQPSLSSDAISANISSSESDSEHMEESSIDPDFYHSVITPTTSESATNKTNKQMRLRLKNLAAVCDRAGVSDRSGSLIASALLKDLDIISQKDKYGPQHILNMIKRCAYLEDDKKAIVFRTIQRNSFFAHSENVLLAMLQDERGHIQELALRRIMKARKTNKGKKIGPRKKSTSRLLHKNILTAKYCRKLLVPTSKLQSRNSLATHKL